MHSSNLIPIFCSYIWAGMDTIIWANRQPSSTRYWTGVQIPCWAKSQHWPLWPLSMECSAPGQMGEGGTHFPGQTQWNIQKKRKEKKTAVCIAREKLNNFHVIFEQYLIGFQKSSANAHCLIFSQGCYSLIRFIVASATELSAMFKVTSSPCKWLPDSRMHPSSLLSRFCLCSFCCE